MINKETILSLYNDRLTLMQWLKTVNKALEDATLTGVDIKKKGNATIAFVFTFADGTTQETPYIVLQEGESVKSAYIEDAKLYIVITS